MDVDRLMKDLNVDQLEKIEKNLVGEMEVKKEELREMVGRRYRDVLEASSEVRQVLQLTGQLATRVHDTRLPQTHSNYTRSTREQLESLERFMALHRLLPIIGCDESDALGDALLIIIVENLHKQLLSEHIPPMLRGVTVAISMRVLSLRSNFLTSFRSELGELSNVDWVLNQLCAIALVTDSDLDALLGMYLSARKAYMHQLMADSSSLLSLIDELRCSLEVVEELFVNGALGKALQSLASSPFCPPVLERAMNEEAFCAKSVLVAQCERAHERHSGTKWNVPSARNVNEICESWTNEMCTALQQMLTSLCQFYTTSSDLLQFVEALGNLLSDLKWPRIMSNISIYQKVCGNVIVKKLEELLLEELSVVEKSFITKRAIVDHSPGLLFDKTRNSFDPMMGRGISVDLANAVNDFVSNVKLSFDSCTRYERSAVDDNDSSLRTTFTKAFVDTLKRMSESAPSTASGNLLNARVCWTLLHNDQTRLLLNKDGEKIAQCSRLLHSAIEHSLVEWCTNVASECICEDAFAHVREATRNPVDGSVLATEWENVVLAEVGSVQVPTCSSTWLQVVLVQLVSRLASASVAHLLSRNTRKMLSTKIGDLFALHLAKALDNASCSQRTWIQLLFDSRVLSSLFPHKGLKDIVALCESKMDPFDLSIMSNMLSNNVRLVVQRSQLLYACLLTDILPQGDNELSPSFSKIVDIVARCDVPRIAHIPRLDRKPTETAKFEWKDSSKKQTNTSKSVNAPTLSSFYDKISSSWFGGGN